MNCFFTWELSGGAFAKHAQDMGCISSTARKKNACMTPLCCSVLESSKVECFPNQEWVSSTGLAWGNEIQSWPCCCHTDIYVTFCQLLTCPPWLCVTNKLLSTEWSVHLNVSTNMYGVRVDFSYTVRWNVTRKFQTVTQTLGEKKDLFLLLMYE